MKCCSQDSISKIAFWQKVGTIFISYLVSVVALLLHCICNLYMPLLGGVQQKEEKRESFNWAIFRSILSLESNIGRDTGLFMRLHYDLVTLKIGSEGGLPANWKTNQYNSIQGLVPPSHITSLLFCSPPLPALRRQVSSTSWLTPMAHRLIVLHVGKCSQKKPVRTLYYWLGV